MSKRTSFTSVREKGRVEEILTANKTLDAEDTGKVFRVQTNAITITLPATVVGLVFQIECDVDGVGFNVSPNASDKIMGPDYAGADNKDYILTAASAEKGDKIVLHGDGANGYFVANLIGTWTQEA